MNAKTRCPAQAPHRRAGKRKAGGSRFVLTTMLSAIGLFLWVLPSAEAESTREAASAIGTVQPAMQAPGQAAALAAPFTVAANGPFRLTIGGADDSQANAAAEPPRLSVSRSPCVARTSLGAYRYEPAVPSSTRSHSA